MIKDLCYDVVGNWPYRPGREEMVERQPWATCLLTDMLIRHLGAAYPEASLRMDYQQLLASTDLVQDIPDPHTFLSDPHNWEP